MSINKTKTQTPIAGPSRTKDDSVKAILENASEALGLAMELAPLLPIPILGTIFASAKMIVDAAGKVRQNRRECAELAEKVANIAHDVRKTIRGREELVDDSLRMALEQLHRDFEEIRTVMKNEAKRGLFSRIAYKSEITGQIAELGARLGDSMRTFQTTSSIRLEVKLELVSRTVSGIDGRLAVMDKRAHNERKWDGQYRIYRMGEIDFGRQISRARRILYYPNMTEGNVRREITHEDLTTARIKGQVVAVKAIRGRDEMFKGTLSALKKVRHSNLVQLEGYSKDDESDVRFVVFKGKLRRLEDHMDSLDTAQSRYQLYLRGVMSTLSAHLYLVSQGLVWLGRNADTMVNLRNGEVILGAQDEILPYAPTAEAIAANSTTFATRFLEILPSLVEDWDHLRDRAAVMPRGYSPVMLEPEYSASWIKSMPQSSIVPLDNADREVAERTEALHYIATLLSERIKRDITCMWNEAWRRRLERRQLPPLGSIVALWPGNDEDDEDTSKEDFVPLEVFPENDMLDRMLIWTIPPPHVRTRDTDGEPVPYPENDLVQLEVNDNFSWVQAVAFLVERGPALARAHGVRLRHLGIMVKAEQEVRAAMQYLKPRQPKVKGLIEGFKSNKSSEASPTTKFSASRELEVTDGGPPKVYLHALKKPNEEFYEEPWGYFSTSETPLPEGTELPIMRVSAEDDVDFCTDLCGSANGDARQSDVTVEEEDENGRGDSEDDEDDAEDDDDEGSVEEIVSNEVQERRVCYKSAVPHIRGALTQTWYGQFLRLHPDQADVLEWMEAAMDSTEVPEYQFLRVP